MLKKYDGKTIIFYDGLCIICNGLVQFILKRDHQDQFRFAPLQSDFATHFEGLPLPKEDEDFKTIFVIKNQKLFSHSDAALEIFETIGGVWSLTRVFRIFPKGLRDFIYLWISKNRYKWFGKKEVCPMPEPSQRKKFLN